jgi:hypothetical protein
MAHPDIRRVILDPNDIDNIIGQDAVEPVIVARAMYECGAHTIYVGENKSNGCIFWLPADEGIGSRSVRGRFVRVVALETESSAEEMIAKLDALGDEMCSGFVQEIEGESMKDIETLNSAGSSTPMPGFAFIVVSVE